MLIHKYNRIIPFSGFVLVNHAGFEIVEVPVDAQGVVRLDALRDALREDTALIGFSWLLTVRRILALSCGRGC